MAFTNRYQKTIKGNMIQIGNTLGLSKASNANSPGTLGSIGAFITTQNINAPGWPNNTTLLFSQNSSSAILTLPTGAIVDYAELIWSASNVVPGADVTASIGNAISFIDAKGNNNSITATGVNMTGIALSENAENSTNYVKSADVTSIISAAGSGTYTCGSVPATMSATCNSLQYAGWSLYVIYRLSTEPVRNIILFVGQTVSIDVPYAVPINYPGPPFKIRIYYTAGEGDAIITADQFNTRPATGVNIINIGTPVQPANSNPFSSIIGNQSGGIDTTGTFGTANPSGTSATNISGGRQGWDIANNIDITNAFTGGAVASLGLDIGTNSDPAILLGNGFVVDLSQPIATLTKSVDKTLAKSGDTLNYTLVYRFTTLPMSAANIIIVDTVPSGTTFQSGSVIINGTPQASANPNPPGINLGTITALTTFTVQYKATVNNVIQTATIPNDAFGSYQFVSNATPFVNENVSNSVLTTVDPFNATATKSVDKAYAKIGDTLTYTITIPNNGATLTNVIFKDTIPNGTALVPNTFTVNSTPISGANPSSGVSLGTIPNNTFTTITFQVTVTTIPAPNPIPNNASISSNYTLDPSIPNGASGGLNTNTANTQVNTAILSTSKQVSKTFANVGDILTYTIPMFNSGNVTAMNLLFVDTIPNGTSLIAGSFKQDGVNIVGNPNPPGALLPINVRAATASTVVFQVRIDTIPNPNPIINNANTGYSYTVDPSITNGVTSDSSTNNVSTQVNNANLGNVSKSVDKIYADCGDILTYTILVPNVGNVTAQNVVFKDTIPNGTVLVANSVTINNVTQAGANPQSGVTVPNISPGTTTTITFKVKVQC